jgi:ribonuclease HI
MTKRPASPRGSPSGSRLFDESVAPAPPRSGSYTFNIDGAARGNPGPASYGVIVREPSGAIVARLKKYIGRFTNNVAEYYGLIAALDYAQSHGIRRLRIESDSELLVKQMRGQYKVKSAVLRPLFERAKKMSQSFDSFVIEHVFRERNVEADGLANEALDETSGASPSRLNFFSGKKLTDADLRGEQRSGRLEKPGPGRIRARYSAGALHPLDPLQLSDGTIVELTLHLSTKERQ